MRAPIALIVSVYCPYCFSADAGRARAVISIRHFSIEGVCIFINRIKIGNLGKCLWGEMIQWKWRETEQERTSCGRLVAHGKMEGRLRAEQI